MDKFYQFIISVIPEVLLFSSKQLQLRETVHSMKETFSWVQQSLTKQIKIRTEDKMQTVDSII